jgi:hypothetical protein
VFQQIRLSAAIPFQETVGPFSRRGRVLIAGGVFSMRNLLLALLQRGQNSHVDPGFFEGASSVRSNRPSRQRSARDSAPRFFAPEKQLGDQAAEKFIRQKIERLHGQRVNA